MRSVLLDLGQESQLIGRGIADGNEPPKLLTENTDILVALCTPYSIQG